MSNASKSLRDVVADLWNDMPLKYRVIGKMGRSQSQITQLRIIKDKIRNHHHTLMDEIDDLIKVLDSNTRDGLKEVNDMQDTDPDSKTKVNSKATNRGSGGSNNG